MGKKGGFTPKCLVNHPNFVVHLAIITSFALTRDGAPYKI